MITIPAEPDHVPRRPLVQASIVIVVAILASVVAVVLLAGRHLGFAESRGKPPSRIDTSVFPVATNNERALHAAEERLQRYGWTDQRARRIHVPLEVAIELYLTQAKAKESSP